MRSTLVLIILTISVTGFAETITLKGGESIRIGQDVVKCEGSVNNSGSPYARYADMRQSVLINLLKSGLGACRVETTSGSNPNDFFYSNNFNGLHVNRNSMNIIRNDIRDGGCD